jgi:uncharacterized damage-inducible protein DinB
MTKLADLIQSYLDGIATLRESVAGLTPAQARARPVPGRMSTLGVVCHLADFELVYAERVQRVLALERPLVLAADDNLFTAALSHDDRDLAEELDYIEAVRRHLARVLQTKGDDVLARPCVHSEAGVMTLEQLLGSVTSHVLHHVRFIEEKRRAMGV